MEFVVPVAGGPETVVFLVGGEVRAGGGEVAGGFGEAEVGFGWGFWGDAGVWGSEEEREEC